MKHPFLPDFLSIPVVFYIIVAISPFNVTELRHAGWLFNMGDVSEPWYHFYSYFGVFLSFSLFPFFFAVSLPASLQSCSEYRLIA